jgi:catechol-2,3-dioxygenase
MATTTNETTPSPSSLLSPSALCHVVLRTTPANYNAMVSFYLTFLGGAITHANPRITFISYDYEHHRIAILADPRASPQDSAKPIAGLAHIAFGFPTLADLATSYEQKKAAGMLPGWAVNHGMSTSMYYSDPDGNELETQVDNFDTAEEAIAFMGSEKFAENPVGVDFEPEEFVRRVRGGEDEASIKKRGDVGRRMGRL